MMTYKMRDGSEVSDPRLGRLPEFDEQSRKYSVGDIISSNATIKGKTWYLPIYLDQEQTSACTGEARTYDLAGSPTPLRQANRLPFDQPFAQALYRLAQRYDEWAGEDYEGSSVLGAAKAAQALGFIGVYRWAFNMEDMLLALSTVGPVVVGTTWFNTMFYPQDNGVLTIDPSKGEAGGHSYIIRGVIINESYKKRLVGKARNRPGVALLRVRNSWGLTWGKKGECLIWADDYQNHLMPGGEQMITTTAFHR